MAAGSDGAMDATRCSIDPAMQQLTAQLPRTTECTECCLAQRGSCLTKAQLPTCSNPDVTQSTTASHN
eukprot:158243-Pelagomonas_calceolata.AAC.1